MSNSEYTEPGLVIRSVERTTSSAMGNPNFFVTFTNGLTARTQNDSSIGYEVTNEAPTASRPARPLDVRFSRAGRIVWWVKASEEVSA